MMGGAEWMPMDTLDAGVYVSRYEARVPKHAQMVMWGPLQAKEMGLDAWEVQDGGETGFILHKAGHLRLGRGTSTLIFVRRLERAFLTVYMGGYPTDVPGPQRRMDVETTVKEAELFLKRLAKEPVQFEFKGELALVENTPGGQVIDHDAGGSPKTIGGGRRMTGKLDRTLPPGAVAGVDMVGTKDKKKGQTYEV